jgi:hypothetical protein
MRRIRRRDVIRGLAALTSGLATLPGLRAQAGTPPRWRKLDGPGPGPRAGLALAPDPRGRLVLVGGHGAGGDPCPGTWVFDSFGWRSISVPQPPPWAYPAVAFDAARGRTVLFGGADARGAPSAETWLWDGQAWARAWTPISPAARSRAAMAYDPAQRLVVLFGGFGPGYLGDTWAWDGDRWTQLAVEGPSPRLLPAMAAAGHGLVLHGGFDGARLLGDTWVLTGGRWQPANGLPLGRAGAMLAPDPVGGGLVLFGGQTTTTGMVGGDAWRWQGAWQAEEMTGPAARMGAGMTAMGQRIVLFGGQAAGRCLADTWWLA